MITFLILSLLGSSSWGTTIFASSRSPQAVNNCEVNVEELHNASVSTKADEFVILIARLGRKEKSRSINFRRLHNAKTYLTKFLGRDGKTVITAEGDPADNYGCVEIYIGGKLLGKIELRPGEDLRVGSCDNTSPGDKIFYGATSKRIKR